jgi:hypothetical protein
MNGHLLIENLAALLQLLHGPVEAAYASSVIESRSPCFFNARRKNVFAVLPTAV